MTTGIGLLKKEYPKLCLISRAHGGDIYLERHNPPYIPCRDMSLSMVDHIFTASRDGEYYLKKRYPLYSSLFESSYLGVSDPMFSTKYSTDNILRIVSCSSLVPVKRVELILEGVLYTAKTNPGKRFEWHHFGDGPLQEKFNKAIKSKSYSNVAINFMGFQPRNIILNFYRDNPVDVFINTSSSEGGNPVSIMEAISCGIPVIATKVGGNMEICF
jgi:glycosyltransferase involved in cell wall biosynthesis